MHILTLGDVILDRNYFGTTTRMAPEASHVPIYKINRTETLLGGAANVAKNLGNLPDVTVELFTVLGPDAATEELTHLLSSSVQTHFIREANRQTTVKHRIFDEHTRGLVNRYDCESVDDITTDSENRLLAQMEQTLQSTVVDAIVLIDYNKGVLTERLAGAIIALANTWSIPTFVDPKVKNYLKYRNCFCFKPNLYEGRVLTGRNNPSEVLQALQNTLNPKCIVLTCGAEGLYMTQPKPEPEPCTAAPLFHHMPHTQPVTVVDVTGAGDTAMSILVYLYCRDHCMRTACQAVNRICSKSVQCIGNYTLSVQDFYPDAPEKLLTVLKKTHRRCARIVFTNGCFDLIHAAHIQLLQFAKQQGDVLVVGLNSDASVRRLKGPTRPVNTERERIALLESLPWVDYVVPFDEDTPADLINVLRPHVLVKGGDYTHATIVGRDAVDEVICFDYQKDRSSTGMIDRILALQEQKAEAGAEAEAEADIISV